MCGILGVVCAKGREPAISREVFAHILVTLAHRGPDGEGIVGGRDGSSGSDASVGSHGTPPRDHAAPSQRHFLLGHRRLAIIQPTSAGAQPMRLTAGIVTYNGELYNDEEVRGALETAGAGVRWRTSCDTETFGEAWLHFGTTTPKQVRGMYAGAIIDERRGRLILTRDPLGVKPLYWSRVVVGDTAHIAFASEVRALVSLMREITGIMPLPDMGVVSAYATTIRTTLGDRTLFEGCRTLLPGQTLSFDLGSAAMACERSDFFARVHRSMGVQSESVAARTQEVIEESVRRHLRSDVPVCVLLSGGLDSAIIASIASGALDTMRTFCAGARDDSTSESPDFAFARTFAAQLGSRHEEVIVTRDQFIASWLELSSHLGTPLSTPNEVAILAVSRALRAQGCLVALSGEGADEIFAGYDAPLDAAWRGLRCASDNVVSAMAGSPSTRSGRADEGELALRAASWITLEEKVAVLTPDAHAAIDEDSALRSWYQEEFKRIAAQREDDHPLQAHTRWLRRTNLPGLLQRLDTATMFAGVEGRTPFADSEVMEWGESLAMDEKFVVDANSLQPTALRTKLVLRRAFAGVGSARTRLPDGILLRPKASFPLPFERWIGEALSKSPQLQSALRSNFAREMFSTSVLTTLARGGPEAPWTLAWPVVNLVTWGSKCWG